jgi:hypothetical protein
MLADSGGVEWNKSSPIFGHSCFGKVSSFVYSGTRRSAPADPIGSSRTAPEPFIQDGVRCRIDAGGFRGPFQEPWTCLWPCRMIVCRSRRAWVKTKSMMLYAFWRVRCVRHGVRVPTLILNTAGGDEADWRLFYIGRADEC